MRYRGYILWVSGTGVKIYDPREDEIIDKAPTLDAAREVIDTWHGAA